MAFFEQRFPERISSNANGGPRWSTAKVYSTSGRRYTNRMWTWPLQSYIVEHPVRTNAEFQELRAFVYVVGGDADGFRFKDATDYTDEGGGILSLVSGADYQMHKRYAIGSRFFHRVIQKPVAGIQIFRTRSGSTTNITGASVVQTTTGRVTVADHISGDAYAWTGQFDVPVAFADGESVFRAIGGSSMLIEWPSISLEEIRL